MAQQVKQPPVLAVPASHTQVLVQVPLAPLAVQLPANVA